MRVQYNADEDALCHRRKVMAKRACTCKYQFGRRSRGTSVLAVRNGVACPKQPVFYYHSEHAHGQHNVLDWFTPSQSPPPPNTLAQWRILEF